MYDPPGPEPRHTHKFRGRAGRAWILRRAGMGCQFARHGISMAGVGSAVHVSTSSSVNGLVTSLHRERLIGPMVVLPLVAALLSGCLFASTEASPTLTASPSATPSPTASPTATPSPTPSATPSATPTPIPATPSPTAELSC